MTMSHPKAAAHSCPPRCVQPSLAWLGLASPQLQGHREGRQALAGPREAPPARRERGGAGAQAALLLTADTAGHTSTAGGSARGGRQGLLQREGRDARSRDTLQQWHRGGHSRWELGRHWQQMFQHEVTASSSQRDCGSLSGAQMGFTLCSLCQH